MIVAVTGDLCSGKTTLCNLFKKKGARVFDADQYIHRYYRDRASPVYKKIKREFKEALTEGGTVSRKKLRAIVFEEPRLLQKLEAIVHPVLIKELKRWIKTNRAKGGIYIAEIPLLFEKKLDILFNRVILVYASKTILFKRIQKKFGLSRKDASSRLQLFKPWKSKIQKADFVIRNSSNSNELRKKAGLVWQKLKREQ